MFRKVIAPVCMMVAMALLVGFGMAADDKKEVKKDDKLPSIKEIMKANNTKKGLVNQVKAQVAAKKWEEAEANAAKLFEYAAALGKNTPPRGEKESWSKLCTAYCECAKAIHTNVKEKKADEAMKAIEAISAQKSCADCHSKHEPKKDEK
jgi:hypothetical protein